MAPQCDAKALRREQQWQVVQQSVLLRRDDEVRPAQLRAHGLPAQTPAQRVVAGRGHGPVELAAVLLAALAGVALADQQAQLETGIGQVLAQRREEGHAVVRQAALQDDEAVRHS